jgi:hypothetical protein
MDATQVINLRDQAAVATARAAGRLVRIDRRSRWGNPFRLRREADRAQVIARYRAWLLTQPDLLAALPTLRGKALACWCAPRPCHGDVLVALVEGLAESVQGRGTDGRGPDEFR